MSYTEPDQPDPDRRALVLGAVASLPVVGGLAELASRLVVRSSSREGMKAAARAVMSSEGERAFPFAQAADVAADRAQQKGPGR